MWILCTIFMDMNLLFDKKKYIFSILNSSAPYMKKNQAKN